MTRKFLCVLVAFFTALIAICGFALKEKSIEKKISDITISNEVKYEVAQRCA